MIFFFFCRYGYHLHPTRVRRVLRFFGLCLRLHLDPGSLLPRPARLRLLEASSTDVCWSHTRWGPPDGWCRCSRPMRLSMASPNTSIWLLLWLISVLCIVNSLMYMTDIFCTYAWLRTHHIHFQFHSQFFSFRNHATSPSQQNWVYLISFLINLLRNPKEGKKHPFYYDPLLQQAGIYFQVYITFNFFFFFLNITRSWIIGFSIKLMVLRFLIHYFIS